jgi:dTDP-4-amino-4,6-dideoxyglucose
MTLPIVRPQHPRLFDIDSYFDKALETGNVTNNGDHVQAFEAKLTELLGVPTICLNSGMSALVAMLRAIDVVDMDVIVPSFTFAATPHAVILAGGRPVFADIDEQTLCLDPIAAERAITGRTTAIMGVDAYGLCWQPPKGWSAGGHIDVLIDSAPAFGSEISGTNSYARAKAQVYSFHATKPFSTMEGGCLCSSDPTLIDRAKAIRNFGIGQDGKVEQIGINGKMIEVCAIIGLKQLETWPERRLARSVAEAALHDTLEEIRGIKLIKPPSNQMPIWTYMPILVTDNFGVPRDIVVKKLHEKGIMVRQYYEPCHLMPAYQYNPKYPSGHVKLAVTEHIAEQVIALPVYGDMKKKEINEISGALRSIQKEYA